MTYTDKGATLSIDGAFRYHLWRTWEGVDLFAPRSAIFIMLNPSTADALEDDPTIRRCVGFAKSWKCERLDVVNLFAYRTSNPNELRSTVKTTGLVGDPANDLVIVNLLNATRSAIVVCAWGEHGMLLGRGDEMRAWLMRLGVRPKALRISESGQPGHPLYIPADMPLIDYV